MATILNRRDLRRRRVRFGAARTGGRRNATTPTSTPAARSGEAIQGAAPLQ